MKKAIVTLAIGQKHETLFEKYCRENWQQYCDMFNFKLIVINEPLDKSERANKRSPSWQKLLILSQPWSKNYDQIVWVDCDVIINNSNAQDITTNVPLNMVGGVDQYTIPTKEIFDISLQRLYDDWKKNNVKFIDNKTPSAYYINRGLPNNQLNQVLQAGIFVCSPAYHRDKFESIYNNYEDTHGGEWNFENPAMSFELVKDGMVNWLPSNFNFCVINILAAFYPFLFNKKVSALESLYDKIARKLTKKETIRIDETEQSALKSIYDLSTFMHFAGCAHLMPKMKPILNNKSPNN
ncbi:hypothetical protein [Mucilaginibacter rubeus]|uniref:hypothetical protein n=1 Tax=Mucilaginibacter rubeus TaxID=2027860 RepID=UPI00166D5233|nr:hypothetical protein [Mucilaginibacter rubeus]GGB14226.1 hypothetical protein GCM10011500_32760 [Mucilaginibacter rubeus]